ncbi:unnamed protein product [Calypogeia fissa]
MPIMNRKSISEPSHSLERERERGLLGILKARKAGQVSEIDWNSLLRGKKVISEQELADAEVEAPRNSLESSPGRGTPRLSGVRHDDIPYAVEISKPMPPHYGRSEEIFYSRASGEFGRQRAVSASAAEVLPIKTLIAQDSSDAEHEKKRRSAPSVVARLMGLDTLPDILSKGSPTKPPKHSSKSSQSSRKDTKPHSTRAETCSRPPSPLHDVETIRDFPLPKGRAQTDADACEDKTNFDVLPFRSHPQERQLQEFKKEFMEKLANQRYGIATNSAATTTTNGAVGDRDVGAKRKLLREKLSEAKQALASGGDESRRLSSAQEKLMESKEFQDAIELLQTNKEFFKKFFPESNSMMIPSKFGGTGGGNGNKDPPEPECPSRRSFHLGDSYVEPARHEETTSRRSFHMGDFSRESRKSSFLDEPSKQSSRRSFHLEDLAKDSGRSSSHGHHSQESPKDSSGRRSFHLDDHSSRDSRRSQRYVDDVTKEIRALEDCSDSRHGDYLITTQQGQGYGMSEPRKRRETRYKSPGRNNPVAEEVVIVQKSKSSNNSKERDSSSWPTPDHNITTVKPGSPNNFDARKGCDSPSRIVVLKPGPGEITLLSPAAMDRSCSPHSYRVVRDSRGSLFEAREVILVDPKERFSPPPMVEEPRYSREEYRDPRVDPRAIARDIVREARTNSTRELSRDRETGRDSPRPGHVQSLNNRFNNNNNNNSNNTSYGAKRGSVPKYSGHGLIESMEERISDSDDSAMGSYALAALSKRHAMEEKARSGSPTVPIPSPKYRSQETPVTSDKLSQKEGKLRRFPENSKPKSVYKVEQSNEEQQLQQHRKGGSTEVRVTMGQAHELTRSPMISRPRQYLPGIKSSAAGNKGRSDPVQQSNLRSEGWKGADVNMYTVQPTTEKVVKIETMYPSNYHPNGGNDSQETSPRTVLRSRTIPNAGAMVGTKIRSTGTADVVTRSGSNAAAGHAAAVIQGDRKEGSEHFYLKEKRAEARQAFLLSRKKVIGGGGDSITNSGRLISHEPRPVDCNAAQDLHGNGMSVGSALPLQQHNLSVVTRSSFEKAVPIEGVPRQGPSELSDPVEVLSQRLPQTPPGATDTSETQEFRQPSSRKQLEVPVNQQGSKCSKAWSIATETLENGDGDGASETSVDKCGQPSPVSVLDSPFEAEICSPVEFKELNSDIQDLRLRLRLLKLDGSDRSTVLDSSQAKEKLLPQGQVVRHTENCLESTQSVSSSFNSTRFSTYRDLEPQSLQAQSLLFQTENIDIQGFHCPEGRLQELLYVRNILFASGFTNSGQMMIGKWHSPTCPLDPSLYERLEDSYGQADLQVLEHSNGNGNTKNSNSCTTTEGKCDSSSSSRRLLFDVVNEVLLSLLGPYLSFQPWIQPSTPQLLRPIPTDWELLSATWLEICSYFYPEGVEEFEALDCLMGRDVSSKRVSWVDSLTTYEQIGLELERTIFESLIDETVYSLSLLSSCKSS